MRPRDNTLSGTLSNLPRSSNDNSHDVASCADSDQSWETFGSLRTEYCFKEESSSQFTGLADLGCWNSGKISYIGQDVENEHDDER